MEIVVSDRVTPVTGTSESLSQDVVIAMPNKSIAEKRHSLFRAENRFIV